MPITALQRKIRSRIADFEVSSIQNSSGKTRHENQSFFHDMLNEPPHCLPPHDRYPLTNDSDGMFKKQGIVFAFLVGI